MSTTTTTTTVTPEQAAELFRQVSDQTTKWAFLDGVATMCDQHPNKSQREVVDMIGDTATFIGMHGHHRDGSDTGRKAKSKLKSIRDELSVVKVWAPADRVDGVSFEAHKVLNRLGSSAGRKILTALVKEMGGPGNVTKSAVAARLKVADPDHVPQANGKKPATTTTTTAAGNHAVTKEMTLTEMATALGGKLTVGELSKDAELAKAVEKVADIFEAFAQRKAAKAAAATKTAAKSSAPAKKAAPRKKAAKRPAVKAPAGRAAPKRPSVKAPIK